jgi:hypothetical protein
LPPADGEEKKVYADDSDVPAIEGSISYASLAGQKTLRLVGGVQSLKLSQLAYFFPFEDCDPVMDLLGHIEINTLDVQYDYSLATGQAIAFSINAVLLLGPVKLVLSFLRNPAKWNFQAKIQLHQEIEGAKIGAILASLLGDDNDAKSLVSFIPEFVTDIDLGKASLSLHISSVPNETTGDKPKPGSISVALQFDLPTGAGSHFDVTFVQIVQKQLPTTPDADKSNAKSRVKRLIKVSVGDLPWSKIPKPPIVDTMTPAFDELGFYWVQDTVGAQGLSKGEMTLINSVSKIQYKDNVRGDNDTIVLTAGWHFMVLDSGGHGSPKALLDYAFNKPPPPPANGDGSPREDSKPPPDLFVPTNPGTPGQTLDGIGTAKGAMDKKAGPFTISNVGVRFEGGALIVFCDILANLGPIGILLSGFGLRLNLNSINLKQLAHMTPTPVFNGMAIEFNRPPVQIVGMFIDQSDANSRTFAGGVALTVEPYSFMAVGAYGEVKKPGIADMSLSDASNKGMTFKTVFIYAKLNGPLVELGWATIGGISLGFGYNSSIRLPTIEEVPTFPFISNAAADANTGPLDVMQKLTSKDPIIGVVSPQDGSFWLAAGLEAKAFEILDVSAVIIVEFNPYVSLGIFARAIMQMPPAPTPRTACFTYVELGIAASCDFHAGVLRVEASLSPNSFVMNPLCHLTGGFAMCSWFGDSPYAGNFVFSIGGFHPAFSRPTYYPNPPRLAINWCVSSNLMIRGEAYFAVTPKAVMGGSSLNAVFNMGPLYAYFSAHADFLMTFHPFHLIVDVGISVGVEFDLELLFITIHIGVHCDADLHIEGPPFGGYAYVHFWVFGFRVPFGDSNKRPDPLKLNDFREFLFQVPDPNTLATNAGTSVNKLHTLSVEAGRFTDKQKDGEIKHGEPWQVKRGGFVFRVETKIPIQSISEPDFVAHDTTATTSWTTPFYGVPMHLQNQLTSMMTVIVDKVEHETGVANQEKDFKIKSPILKAMPLSIWGQCKSPPPPSTSCTTLTLTHRRPQQRP